MGHWTPSSDYSDTSSNKTIYDKDGSGVPTQGRVRQIVKSNTQNPKGWEYYELEIAEVMEVFDSEEKLPENDKGEKIWGLLGCIKARPHQSSKDEIPKSGLNFISNKNYEKNFLLLCGFEKFKDFFVRIDILEKLFIKILNKTNKDRKFKINSEMMNLLGCTKENFYKLMTYMNYKKDKNEDTYIFKGEKKKKDKFIKFDKKENPFKKLLSLNLNK